MPATTVRRDASERQLCTFRVGELLLGLDVLSVQEVLYHSDITAVPHSPHAVTGLINLRGQIATAIDLHARLDVARDPEAKKEQVHVVVRYRNEPVSLMVDEIGDVMTVDSEIYEQPPETVSGIARELITGAYKLPNELLLTLDVERTIAMTRTTN
ncbi:MAG: chemotaxis protein CheW [Acidimicrobiales bacterium]